MIGLLLFIIVSINGVLSRNCSETELCPSDKPFCSEVGCIFECPAPFYINGSNCVSDCGEMFVDENRNCISACPEGTFYKETLKQTICKPYLERKCVKCSLFISSGSCVNVCPSESRYIDGNNCVQQCPEERPFKVNTTIHGLPHYKCRNICPSMRDGNFCSNACPGNKLVIGSLCMEQCPSNIPYLLHNSCLTQCPYDAPADGFDNKTCVQSKCPDKRPYVVNNTCVESCPGDFSLTYSTINIYNRGFEYCIKECGDKYRYKDKCVFACPFETVAVKNTCADKCPMYTSYMCLVKVGHNCGEKPDGGLAHSICVNECPKSMLIWKNTCVFSCNSGLSIFERECTETCPVVKPYKQNITNGINCRWGRCENIKTDLYCVEKCSTDYYIYKYTCFQYCPSHSLYSGSYCMSKCPKTKPFKENSTITIQTWSYDSRYYGRHYKEDKEQKHIQQCVAACGTGTFYLNHTCVKVCPDGYTLPGNRTCSHQKCDTKYEERTRAGIICLETCKPKTFSLNKTCVDTCTGTHMKFHLNNTCIEKCPHSYNNMAVSIANEVEYYGGQWKGDIILNNCTKECGDEYFQFNGSCVNYCHPPLLTFERMCVENCPLNASLYMTSSVSFTDKIIESSGRNFIKEEATKTILRCLVNCPNSTMLLDSKCVDTCPLDRQYIVNGSCQRDECKTKYRFYNSTGIKCFDTCPSDLFISNTTCVFQCLNDQYVFDQTCVHFCPSTHAIIDERHIARDLYNCDSEICAKHLAFVKECRANCPPEKFLFNKECKNVCPNNTVIHTNRCIEVCPNSHLKVEKTELKISKWLFARDKWFLRNVTEKTSQCVLQCSQKYPLQFDNSCLSKCPKDFPYQVNGMCVEACPGNTLIDLTTKLCVDKCAQTVGEFNRSCHNRCPKHIKYIFNARCVSECPSSHPVALEKDRFVCRKSCGDSKLFKDGECIKSYLCDDPMFEYNGLCLHRCPVGLVWMTECRRTLVAKIAVGILSTLLVLLIVLSRQFLLDFKRAARLVFMSYEMIEEEEKQLIQLESNSKLKQKNRGAEDVISLHELIPHMEDEHTF